MLSNGVGCRQQPPTVEPEAGAVRMKGGFLRGQEAGWRRHASWASVANSGSWGLEEADVLELSPDSCLLLACHMPCAPFPLALT